MSKGYADYVIAMMREVDREIQRELDGVEVPLFRDRFENWLKTDTNLSAGTQTNYMRWLGKADSWICDSDSDHDFWTLLKKAWDASDFGRAKALCNGYEKLLLDEKKEAEAESKDEWGASGKEIGDWISAFRKYCKFHDELMKKASVDQRARAAMIESSRETARHLFLEDRFCIWGEGEGLAEDTMDSYVSFIKRVNHDYFCKTGYDWLHDFLPGYVKTKNAAKIKEMFAVMDRALSERIDSCNETEMTTAAFINGRSALRKYSDFIKTLI
ncbi:MAG: hypothetical protein K2L59_00415 [Muribaculaceae bacterium]|nr:hypothetical protein [Muribaculaceae bacterium]